MILKLSVPATCLIKSARLTSDEWRVSIFSFFMNRIEGALRHPSLVMTSDGEGLTIAAFSVRFMSGLRLSVRKRTSYDDNAKTKVWTNFYQTTIFKIDTTFNRFKIPANDRNIWHNAISSSHEVLNNQKHQTRMNYKSIERPQPFGWIKL